MSGRERARGWDHVQRVKQGWGPLQGQAYMTENFTFLQLHFPMLITVLLVHQNLSSIVTLRIENIIMDNNMTCIGHCSPQCKYRSTPVKQFMLKFLLSRYLKLNYHSL